jgi:hypothetical protein
MSRMARNPAPVITERRIRWRKENARSGAEGAFATVGGLAALTLVIVPFRRREGETSFAGAQVQRCESLEGKDANYYGETRLLHLAGSLPRG